MARAKVIGENIVVTTTITKANLELAQKHRSSALEIRDPETKEVTFKIGIGLSSLSDHGITFSSANEAGEATATISLPAELHAASTEEKKGYVFDRAGHALAQLQVLEESFPNAISGINAQRDAIKALITVE